MDTPRARGAAQLLAGMLWLSQSVACNAILGIDEPKDGLLGDDSGQSLGPQHEEDEPRDAGGVKHTDDAGDVDAEGPAPDPSPYAWAEWPMPNPLAVDAGAAQIYEPGKDTVLDTVTQLEWERQADEKVMSRDDAEKYCAGLRISGGGFHMPSRIELLSLVDITQSNPYLDMDAFPDAPIGKYWSSSRYAKDGEQGFVVNFEFGTTLTLIEPGSEERYVRCVRTSEKK